MRWDLAFDPKLMTSSQKVHVLDWVLASWPMVGRSLAEAVMIAMETMKAGLTEAVLVAWESISRRPGDTTGSVVTDLPEDFRTDPTAGFFHRTHPYALPKIREEGFNWSTQGKGFHSGEQERQFTNEIGEGLFVVQHHR